MLAPVPSSTTSEYDDAKYVAVKKLRFDEDTDDDRALALSLDGCSVESS